MPNTLSNFYTSGFYAWDSRALLFVGRLTSPEPASSVHPHTFVLAKVKNSAEDVDEAPIDDDETRKEVTFRSFDLRTCQSKKVSLTTFPVKEVKNLLCAGSRKHAHDLLESTRSMEYQYNAKQPSKK